MSEKYTTHNMCFPVKGYNRSIVYDLTRNDYHFVPNDIADLLLNGEFSFCNNNEKNYHNKWKIFLLDNEIIYKKQSFDENLVTAENYFESPFVLSNLVIHENIDSESLNTAFF